MTTVYLFCLLVTGVYDDLFLPNRNPLATSTPNILPPLPIIQGLTRGLSLFLFQSIIPLVEENIGVGGMELIIHQAHSLRSAERQPLHLVKVNPRHCRVIELEPVPTHPDHREVVPAE